MRIALLSNVAVEVLAGMLRPEHELWLPPGFGAWMQTALAVPDDLKAFDPEIVFLLLDSSHAAYDPPSVDSAVSALEAALPKTTVIVPDLEDLALEFAETTAPENFYDLRLWQLASMPWSVQGLRAIRNELIRLAGFLTGGHRKVLALDFDNTIWKGVIGEDGVSGIEPLGDFQRGIRALRARGVLLVGLSKNNAADVEPVWGDPRMVLTKEDFVDLRIDWNDKSDNLSAVARRLNLGTDSFVFVDDDPVERAQMTVRHPEVLVPDGPLSVRRIARMYFPKLRLTAEDLHKTDQYRSEERRRALAETLSVEEYLARLEIRAEIHPIVADEFPRVAQLSQKANQFNVCTHRLTVDDVACFAADPSHLLVTLHASDKFGDQGLVGFVRVADNEILDFVMSCRAMNRRLEFTVCAWIERALRKRGATELRATWCKTSKNEPVRELYEKLGFEVVHSTEEEKRYAKVLD